MNYYVFKNECCTTKDVGMIFSKKSDFKEYLSSTDYRFVTSKKNIPFYVKKLVDNR